MLGKEINKRYVNRVQETLDYTIRSPLSNNEINNLRQSFIRRNNVD